MKNDQQQHHPNVMDRESMLTPPKSREATTANEAPVDARLQRWIDFCEQTANEVRTPDQHNTPPPFTDNYDESRKANTEKRLNAKLRKMEGEQKAILLAEAHKSLKEARREFESQPQVSYDYTPGPPSSINDFFCAEKERNRLIALELEQKEQLFNEVMEKRARECGEKWSPAEEDMNEKLRYDHILKYWPGEKEIIAKAFPGPRTVAEKESHE